MTIINKPEKEKKKKDKKQKQILGLKLEDPIPQVKRQTSSSLHRKTGKYIMQTTIIELTRYSFTAINLVFDNSLLWH